MPDPFMIANTEIMSRLILGTGGAPSMQVIDETIVASGTAMCTVANVRFSRVRVGAVVAMAMWRTAGRFLERLIAAWAVSLGTMRLSSGSSW